MREVSEGQKDVTRMDRRREMKGGQKERGEGGWCRR